MTFKSYDELESSEKEYFASVCAKCKLSPADFHVTLEEGYQAEKIGNLLRVVHVARLGRNGGKHYPARTGTSWLIAFEQDLLGNLFD
jgi:hypothetical protein